MTAFDYSRSKATATRLLTRFAQGTVQLAVVTPGGGPSYDPGTPTTALTTLSATVKGVSKQYVDAGLVTGSDLQVTAAVVAGIDPDLADYLMIDGHRRDIVKFMPIPSAGTAAAWVFLVKGDGVAA